MVVSSLIAQRNFVELGRSLEELQRPETECLERKGVTCLGLSHVPPSCIYLPSEESLQTFGGQENEIQIWGEDGNRVRTFLTFPPGQSVKSSITEKSEL